MRKSVVAALCISAALLGACGKSGEAPSPAAAERRYAQVDAARLEAPDDNAGQWMSHGRDYGEQRFSPLTKIDADNVGQLGLAWFADFDTRRGQESTPIVVDGVIYVTTAWSKVKAFDAKTGQNLWNYDPKVAGEYVVNACCDVVNRGVAVWNGKVYLGAFDGRLIALDAATGKEVWVAQTTDPQKAYSITGAPRIARGKVLIGQAGSEYYQRGYVSAYDAETGKLDWRWYIVPGNPAEGFENPQMEAAARTWAGEWWKTGGGGAPWDGITYDPVTDLVYVGTGNGAPWPAEIRSPGGGDHLYLSSIVALKRSTGEYVWHYQATPNESWDYDNTQQITVAELQISGQQRRVVMQASKNGFFYILDAATGELLSAEPYVPVNWARGVDLKTGRPSVNPEANYSRTGRFFIAQPSYQGGHNWPPMSYSPRTGLMYIPAVNFSYPFFAVREDDNPLGQKLSISFAKAAEVQNDPKSFKVNEAYLLAWDPVRQKEVWRHSYGAGRGGGTLATAGGLVFQGNTTTFEFNAFRADTGERLWASPVQTGVMAGPMSYEVDGEQYVAAVAGFRTTGNYYAPNYSRLLVYKLGGTAKLPPEVEIAAPVLDPPVQFGSAETLEHGKQLYYRFCGTCHGTDGQSRGMFPDLRYSRALNTADAFRTIVIDGALTPNGMVSFAKALTPDDAEAVRAFMVSRAHEAVSSQPAGAPATPARPQTHSE